jgi:hypothetical protein
MLKINMAGTAAHREISSGFLASGRRSIIFHLLALATTPFAFLLGGCDDNGQPIDGYIGTNNPGNVTLPDTVARGLISQAGTKVHTPEQGKIAPGRLEELCKNHPAADREKLYGALRSLALEAAVRQVSPKLSLSVTARAAEALGKEYNSDNNFPLTPFPRSTEAAICADLPPAKLSLGIVMPFDQTAVRRAEALAKTAEKGETPCSGSSLFAVSVGEIPIITAGDTKTLPIIISSANEAGDTIPFTEVAVDFIVNGTSSKMASVTVAEDFLSIKIAAEASISEKTTRLLQARITTKERIYSLPLGQITILPAEEQMAATEPTKIEATKINKTLNSSKQSGTKNKAPSKTNVCDSSNPNPPRRCKEGI